MLHVCIAGVASTPMAAFWAHYHPLSATKLGSIAAIQSVMYAAQSIELAGFVPFCWVYTLPCFSALILLIRTLFITYFWSKALLIRCLMRRGNMEAKAKKLAKANIDFAFEKEGSPTKKGAFILHGYFTRCNSLAIFVSQAVPSVITQRSFLNLLDVLPLGERRVYMAPGDSIVTWCLLLGSFTSD
ncbi:hypothetical protein Q3G72_010667 [Acer saccharum]|nr:hypothetical protein Q3G72_010667 [Acer saccharum]